jgi:hypothetical protein
MFSLTKKIREGRGQSTVEAAFALPLLMILTLMLIQPAIILYDKIIMQNAANEGIRLLTTSSYYELDGEGLKSQSELNEGYIRRRLSAIPQANIFHVHSSECSYSVQFSGDETSNEVSVVIENQLRPLPLIGMIMNLAGATNDEGYIVITVSASAKTQPDWLTSQDSTLNPKEWTGS